MITDLDVLVFVVNITHRHWQVIAVFPDKKKIEIFDSLGSTDLESCQAIWYFLVELYHRDLDEVVDWLEWHIYFGRDYIPKQQDGFNCGLFANLIFMHAIRLPWNVSINGWCYTFVQDLWFQDIFLVW